MSASNASVISEFWSLCSVYWINRQVELQLIITLSILLWSHSVNYSEAGLLYSSVVLVPIHCLVCVLLDTSIIHSSLHSLLIWNWLGTTSNWTVFILARTELNWKWLHLELITLPPRRPHRKLRLYFWNVCTNHCIATVAVLTIANPLLLHYPAASTHTSIVACVITCLRSHCLAMLCPFTLHYGKSQDIQ
jgi:hypothetical protein